LFGLKVHDIDCAFKLIKREVIERANIQSSGAFINSEFLIKSKQNGYKIKELPVSHFSRKLGHPTGANIKVILRAMKELTLFRLIGRTALSKN